MCIEHSKHSESRASFLKCLKENVLDLGQMSEKQCLKEDDQKKKEAKEKDSRVQLQCQPAPHREPV